MVNIELLIRCISHSQKSILRSDTLPYIATWTHYMSMERLRSTMDYETRSYERSTKHHTATSTAMTPIK